MATRRISCIDLPMSLGDPVGAAAIVRNTDGTLRVGGQGANVTLGTSAIRYANGIATFDATIANLIAQRLGSLDGTTDDARGVRLVVASGPSTIVGLGATALATAADGVTAMSGTMTVDGKTLPYAQIAGLASGATSATRAISFRVPSNVLAFSFGVYVAAAVRDPNGWVGLTNGVATGTPPSTAAFGVNATKTLALTASVRDAAGRAVSGATVTYASSAPTIATVDASGTVRGVAVGVATITATSGVRVGKATITVGAANAAPAPDVTFSVDPARTFAISRFIYGLNALTDAGPLTAGLAPWYGATTPSGATLNRLGGNRWSAYNWENNASNAGLDYRFQNDNYLSASTSPGTAITSRSTATFSRNAALLVTVPMLPYVANDFGAVPLDTLTSTRAARLAAHFVPNLPTIGTPTGALPDTRDGRVAQDAYVAWVQKTLQAPRVDAQSVFYSLDNEPDLWHSTHAEIMNTLQTYDGFAATTVSFARAVKKVAPNAMVFGPAVATYTGLVTLGRWPTPDPKYGSQSFVEVYLDKLRAAEATEGRRLVDVLDLHWYPEGGTSAGTILNDYATQDAAMIQARLQAPRSLWDPTYTENSWVNQVTGGPIALLPRLRSTIAAHYPGTKLAITEYYYGRGGDISGGLAQADVLGIFGREGVFAATLWPQAGIWAYGGSGTLAYAYAFGGFQLFRNYDGAGATFGDTGLLATTTDPVTTSVYASRNTAGQILVVAINKTAATRTALFALHNGATARSARVYAISQGVAAPTRRTDIAVSATGQLIYSMPAYSASMLVLVP